MFIPMVIIGNIHLFHDMEGDLKQICLYSEEQDFAIFNNRTKSPNKSTVKHFYTIVLGQYY